MRKSYHRNLFVYIFNLGLIFLVIDIALDFFRSSVNSDLFYNVPFSAIGFIICLIAIPFLMIEWLMLPFGTHSKRIKLYQGAGSLFVLAVLLGGWIWREESFLRTNSQINELASITFSSGSLLLTVIFGWLGGQIAAFISKKKIDLGKLNFMNPKKDLPSRGRDNFDPGVKIPVRSLINSVSATPARQN